MRPPRSKLAAVVLTSGLVATMAGVSPALAMPEAQNGAAKPDQTATVITSSGGQSSKDDLSKTKTPAQVSKTQVIKKAKGAPAARAYLASNTSTFQIPNVQSDLKHVSTDRSAGQTAERFSQTYHGIPVFGAQYVVRTKEQGADTVVQGAGGDYFTDLSVNVKASIPFVEAQAVARESLGVRVWSSVTKVEDKGLVIVPRGKGILTRHLTVLGSDREKGMPIKREVYVAAGRTVPVLSYDNIQADAPVATTGEGYHGDAMPLNLYQRGAIYQFLDATRGMSDAPGTPKVEIATYDAKGMDYNNFIGPVPDGVELATTSTIPVPASVNEHGATDAHWGAGKVYDFYRHLGRNSLDGEGGAIKSVVNVSANGRPYYNAFWNGEIMVYGSGGDRPFPAALDVVGHEMTHGVIDHTSDLVYIGQSGALNEALADYFGNAVENTSLQTPAGPDDGLLGEDLCEPEHARDCALRDMRSLMTTFEFFRGTEDGGGVHTNSLIASGSLWDIRVALGADVADPLIYDVMTRYLTPLSQFTDLRSATLTAAKERGLDSYDLSTITAAFNRHGIIPGWEQSVGRDDALTLAVPVLSYFGLDSDGDRWGTDNISLQTREGEVITGRIGTPGSTVLTSSPEDFFGPVSVQQKQTYWFTTRYHDEGYDMLLESRATDGSGQKTTIQNLGRRLIWDMDSDGGNIVWRETTGKGIDRIHVRLKNGTELTLPSGEDRDQLDPTIQGNYVLYGDVPASGDAEMVSHLMRYDLRTHKVVVLATITPDGDAIPRILQPQFIGKGKVLFLSDADFRLRTGINTISINGGKVTKVLAETSAIAPLGNYLKANASSATWENSLSFDAPIRGYQLDLKKGTIGRISCSLGSQMSPVPGTRQTSAWIDTTTASPRVVSRTTPRGTCPEE